MNFQCLVVCASLLSACLGAELTFELSAHDRSCFSQELGGDVEVTLEYQVIAGGQFDVDVVLSSHDGRELYSEQRKQYDTYTFKTKSKGEYKVCFSNEFSTFAHKTVYFDFYTDEDDDVFIPEEGAHHEALTQLESSVVSIHDTLKVVSDYQNRYRLRESHSRNLIEHVWERVQLWSIGETVIIVVVSVGQVIILRRFFPDRRTGI